MPKVTDRTLEEVKAALELYEEVVRESNLTPASQATYLLHADQFLRWLNDGFEPGGTLQ